jgi:uncharacterized protein (DUF4415 family)
MREEYDFSSGSCGPVLATEGKTLVPVWLDDEVFAFFCNKAQTLGRGYQGLINESLKDKMKQSKSTSEEIQHS